MQYDFHNRYPLVRMPVGYPTTLDDHPDLAAWLALTDVLVQRRFLAEHLGLCVPAAWAGLLAWCAEQVPSAAVRQAWADCAVLRRAGDDAADTYHADPGDRVRQAYLDVYGGFADELAPWLRVAEQRLGELLDDRHRLRTGPDRVALLTGILDRLDDGPDRLAVRATLQRELAVAIAENTRARRLTAFEEAIELCDRADMSFQHAGLPVQRALTQIVLGTVLMDRLAGDLPVNYRRAFGCFEWAEKQCAGELPVEHAEAVFGLGNTLQYSRKDERRANQERAIGCYHEAIEVFAGHDATSALGRALYFLASVYWQRETGERADNMEQAIECLRRLEPLWPPDTRQAQHARLCHGLGLMYLERIAGAKRANIELALGYGEQALRVFTREDFPVQHGQGLLNRASMYRQRVAGNPVDNVEQAMSCLLEASRVRTYENFPNEYAVTQAALGRTYQARLVDNREANLRGAAAAYREALRVWTLEASVRDHWETSLGLAEVCGSLGQWNEASEHYRDALGAEDLLVSLGTGVMGQDTVLGRGGDAVTRCGYACYRAGDLASAALCVEQGSARVITREAMIDAADPAMVGDPRLRSRFVEVRNLLVAAHREMNAPLPVELPLADRQRRGLERMLRFQDTRNLFDAVVADIRAASGTPDFLLDLCDERTLRQAAAALGSGGVVVYLVSTPWGGVGLAARDSADGVAALDLPELTDQLIAPFLAGLSLAQRGGCVAELTDHWPGLTVLDSARELQSATNLSGPIPELLRAAVRVALGRPLFRALAATEPRRLDMAERGLLEETLSELVLRETLGRCEFRLASTVVGPLVSWLRSLGARRCALVVSGSLAALPLTASRTEHGHTMAELLPVAVVPNARLLLSPRVPDRVTAGVVAVGDPTGNLSWGQVEAALVRNAAERAGLPARVLKASSATRVGMLLALRESSVVSVACHGTFDHREPLRSALHLAAGDNLTMGDMLARAADLSGVRLLVLSACQTAALDPAGVRDEMRTMAGAMLQAGARAVLGTLWPVDDQATCLLVGRFVAEWFSRMDVEPPARALATAQRWLRELQGPQLAHLQRSQPGLPAPSATVAVRGRGRQPGADGAVRVAEAPGPPMDHPYANPYFWAGLQLVGWSS